MRKGRTPCSGGTARSGQIGALPVAAGNAVSAAMHAMGRRACQPRLHSGHSTDVHHEL